MLLELLMVDVAPAAPADSNTATCCYCPARWLQGCVPNICSPPAGGDSGPSGKRLPAASLDRHREGPAQLKVNAIALFDLCTAGCKATRFLFRNHSEEEAVATANILFVDQCRLLVKRRRVVNRFGCAF